MQLDNPRSGQVFRAMVQNFSNSPAHPHVFVYCGGQRVGVFDAPPAPSNFVTDAPGTYGVMWRVADITTNVDAAGGVSCSATPTTGAALSVDEPAF